MYASFPILQSRPIRAPSRTWTQCQICVPSPTEAWGETSAVGWIRVPIGSQTPWAVASFPRPGAPLPHGSTEDADPSSWKSFRQVEQGRPRDKAVDEVGDAL